jgi:YVTN family beta-propeller protein
VAHNVPLPISLFLQSMASKSVRRLSLILRLMLFVSSLALLSPAFAREFFVAHTVSVGESPEHAVLTPDGRELYVSNRVSGTVTVIDTVTSEITATIEVGKSPGVVLASHDGRRVYVLVENALAIVSTAQKSDVRHIAIPGRTDDLALTRDDRRLYMTRVYEGVYYLDTTTEELHQATSDLCPIGIAVSEDEERLFVNHQCQGPGGSIAHDAIGIYELPSHRPIATIRGLANVGGQLVLSPDGTELWANGLDACSRPDYDHTGCPAVPGRVLNVIRTSDLKLLKSFGFSLEDSNGTISFSPKGEAFVGGGVNLKEIDADNLEAVQRIPIANTGSVAFQADGETAYVTVSDKNLVAVLHAGSTPSEPISRVSSLSLQTVVRTLSTEGYCASDGHCYRVHPQTIASALRDRGTEVPPPTASAGNAEVYRSVANQLLSSNRQQELAQAQQLLELAKNQEYLDWTDRDSPVVTIAQELDKLYKESHPTDEHKRRIKKLEDQLALAEKATAEFRDQTGRINVPNAPDNRRLEKVLQKSPGAVALYTVVTENSYHTLLVYPDGNMKAQEGLDSQGAPMDRAKLRRKVLAFREALSDPDSNPLPLAQELYKILIGNLERELKAANAITLVWWLDDDLRNIPMAALHDGQQYLAQRYANVILTDSSQVGGARVRPLKALAAAVTDSREGLPPLSGAAEELRAIFYEEGAAHKPGALPASILVNDGFNEESLRAGLHQNYPIVHIASHFVLGADEASSYLLLGSGRLTMEKLRKSPAYTFDGVELLTLSACDTAVGLRPDIGSAIEGFGFLAEEKHALAVMATLWEVDDLSTRIFMQHFYSEFQHKKSKAEALQQAELALLLGDSAGEAAAFHPTVTNTRSRYSHPYYWAPFVLMGDWK